MSSIRTHYQPKLMKLAAKADGLSRSYIETGNWLYRAMYEETVNEIKDIKQSIKEAEERGYDAF